MRIKSAVVLLVFLLVYNVPEAKMEEAEEKQWFMSNTHGANVVLKRSVRSSGDFPKTKLKDSFIKKVVDQHNKYRRKEGGSDMEMMGWDNYIASMAQAVAEDCSWDHHQPGGSTYAPLELGQSYYVREESPDGLKTYKHLNRGLVVWYNETHHYDYDTMMCSENAQYTCGHYTQMVYAKTHLVGCGHAICNRMNVKGRQIRNAYFLVCNYFPGQLPDQHPYQKGPACSKCSSDESWCKNKLCYGSSCTGACECNLKCKCGVLDRDNCRCECNPGWMGSACSKLCGNMHYCYSRSSRLDCSNSKIQRDCPLKCDLCQASPNRLTCK